MLILAFLLCPISLHASDDDWEVWGEETSDSSDKIKRPHITGWWNWQYNEFSSFDQARLTLEKDFDANHRLLTGFNVNYYTEDDNKKWKVFPGENYYSAKAGDFDFRLGMLVENIGSGDKFSYVDKINSRYYHNGLANDYDRDKKEVPAIRAAWHLNDNFTLSGHYMPYFMASEFPSIYSKWAYAVHKSLTNQILTAGAVYNEENDEEYDPQFHVQLSAVFPKIEMNFHYMSLKERLPIISLEKAGEYSGTYPKDETIAVNGNVTVSKDQLLRYELAWSRNRTWSAFENGIISKSFTSDQFAGLIGADKNISNDLYINIQGMFSHIPDLKQQTTVQLGETEYLGSFQLRKSFNQEKVQFEINALNNFTTDEYVITPKITVVRSDSLTFILSFQANGEGVEALGPIGQFSENNTTTLETRVTF